MEQETRYVYVTMDDGTLEQIAIIERGGGHLRLERVRGARVQRLDLHRRTLDAVALATHAGPEGRSDANER